MVDVLPLEELEHWRRNGYVHLRNLLSPSDKRALSSWCDEILEWTRRDVPPEGLTVFHEDTADGQRLLWRARGFSAIHPEMARLARAPELMAVVDTLVGAPSKLIADKLHYRFPGSSGFRPHQDSGFSPIRTRIANLAVVIAVDAMDEDNGCFHVAPRPPSDERLLPNEEHFIRQDIVDTLDWRPVRCDAGDVFVFSEYLPHFTEINRSDRSRRAIFFLYRDVSEPGISPEAFYQEDRDDDRR